MKVFAGQVRGMYLVIRTEGWRAAWRKFGWRLLAVVFLYYLVRDLVVYVLVPLLFAARFL